MFVFEGVTMLNCLTYILPSSSFQPPYFITEHTKSSQPFVLTDLHQQLVCHLHLLWTSFLRETPGAWKEDHLKHGTKTNENGTIFKFHWKLEHHFFLTILGAAGLFTLTRKTTTGKWLLPYQRSRNRPDRPDGAVSCPTQRASSREHPPGLWGSIPQQGKELCAGQTNLEHQLSTIMGTPQNHPPRK